MDIRTRMAMVKNSVTDISEKVVTSRTLLLTTGMSEVIKVKRGDHNSRVLRLTVKKDDIHYLDLSNAEVFLVMQKPNGIKLKITGEVINAVNGEVAFALTKDSLSTSGEALCEVVKVSEDGAILSTPSFSMTIQESLFDDFMLGFGEDDFTVITK